MTQEPPSELFLLAAGIQHCVTRRTLTVHPAQASSQVSRLRSLVLGGARENPMKGFNSIPEPWAKVVAVTATIGIGVLFAFLIEPGVGIGVGCGGLICM